MAPPRPMLPPRLLPVLYFGAAHLALLTACWLIATEGPSVAGFFYHPRMLAVVHLVTIGWISASILGSLYLVGPMALRVSLPARWFDYVAFACVVVGAAGMAGHFWIEEFSGMAWSAATAAAGLLIAGAAAVPRLSASAAPRAVLAHVVLAFLNVGAAAIMGVLLAIEKVHHVLPGFVLANVYAHAHLAAIGWASMMVVGVAYRLLPMVLPARMPTGRSLWASAVLIETGVVGLFVSLVLRSRATAACAIVIAAGFAAFFTHVFRMLRNPRPRPPAIRTPDPAVLHAAAAFASLCAATVLGLVLACTATTAWTPRIAAAYGVLGLLGFLAQMVVAMEGRLLPLFAWYWGFANTNFRGPVPSPHEMPWRPWQLCVFALWLVGVPALSIGLALDVLLVIRAAGWCLLAATLLDTAQTWTILRHAYRRPAAAQ